MSRRTIEGLKTGLIVVLLVSAILLGYSSDVFGGLSGAFSPSGATLSDLGAAGQSPAEAARPTMLVLTNSAAERAVFKYDMDTLDLIYERTSGSLGEALGALSTPEECREADWREALKSPGIMFEYHRDMPLELVRDWLGASGDGQGITVRRICLVFEGNAASLYFEGGGSFYTAQTASLGGELSVSTAYDSGIKYLFEQDSASPTPYMIISPDSNHTVALSQNPLVDSSALATAVAVLGIDLRLTSGYTESDGTHVYVSSVFDLRVSPDGVVRYHRDADNTSPVGFCDSVDIARRIAASTIGAFSGVARVYFTGYSYENDDITVMFDYFFDGGRVFFPGHSSAARITVSGGVVTDMTLCFRSFSPGDSTVLLPEAQALAISSGEFALGYADSSPASPFWYSYESVAEVGAA